MARHATYQSPGEAPVITAMRQAQRSLFQERLLGWAQALAIPVLIVLIIYGMLSAFSKTATFQLIGGKSLVIWITIIAVFLVIPKKLGRRRRGGGIRLSYDRCGSCGRSGCGGCS